ncbi:MAG: M28 family peptidase [Bacteroidetes bacterium]|nr:M28 family peptidase [Bacteroidota bacterium]
MKRIFLLPLLTAGLGVFAQKNDASKFASVITGDALKSHLTIIAGDDMQGRETGTEGQRKAAAYIESQFKKIGLKSPEALKGYQQFYPLFQDSMISSKLSINGKELGFETDYIIPASSNDKQGFNSDEVVFVGYGIEDSLYNDYGDLDVKGKTVVFFLGEPKLDGKYIITGTNRSSEWTFPGLPRKLALAARKGAVGALIISSTLETINHQSAESSKKTNLYFPRVKERVVNYASLSHSGAKEILGSDADSLLSTSKGNKPFSKDQIASRKAKLEYRYDEYRNTVNASNVLGVIEGTDKKNEYVFVTGHYDHLGMRNGKIYYGADDDGSGTVAVLQMAAAFAKAKAAGKGPRRTMVFMTVSGEEKGLWGSEYYSDHPVFPLDKTSVDLNIDMIGRVDTERMLADTLNYVYVVGHDKLSSDLPVINEGANKTYTNLTLDYKFDDPNDKERIYFRSDHYNFARKGVPVLFFYDGMLKADYHKPTDTVDKINWQLYETRARMIFYTAWEIANRDAMLKRDIPLPASAMNGR